MPISTAISLLLLLPVILLLLLLDTPQQFIHVAANDEFPDGVVLWTSNLHGTYRHSAQSVPAGSTGRSIEVTWILPGARAPTANAILWNNGDVRINGYGVGHTATQFSGDVMKKGVPRSKAPVLGR
jgi:hypothetical protein